MGLGEGRKRHHGAFAIAHVHLEQVVDLAALVAFGLDDDALHAALVGEVIDVGRTDCSGQYRTDIGKGDAQGIGLVAVHFQLHLRAFSQCTFAHVGQHRALFCGRQQLVARRHQRRVPEAATVLQTEFEATGIAQAVDRRWQYRKHHRLLDGAKRGIRPFGDGGGRVLAVAF
ncbi:hypothetical protein D3C76_953700 [compost metagenome]